MMDQIASLVARGLISPDVAAGLVQRVNDITKGPLGQPPLAGDVGRGHVMGGASGRPTIAPDYSRPIHPDVLRAMRAEQGMDQPAMSGRPIHPDVLNAMREEQGTAPANQNKSPRQQFIDEYDSLVRQKAAKENRKDFRTIKGYKDAPKITAAAARHGDTVGTGTTHSDALYDMADKMGYPVHDNEAMMKLFDSNIMRNVEHGFVTSDGRFLTRGEAMDMVGSPDSKQIVGKALKE